MTSEPSSGGSQGAADQSAQDSEDARAEAENDGGHVPSPSEKEQMEAAFRNHNDSYNG